MFISSGEVYGQRSFSEKVSMNQAMVMLILMIRGLVIQMPSVAETLCVSMQNSLVLIQLFKTLSHLWPNRNTE